MKELGSLRWMLGLNWLILVEVQLIYPGFAVLPHWCEEGGVVKPVRGDGHYSTIIIISSRCGLFCLVVSLGREVWDI